MLDLRNYRTMNIGNSLALKRVLLSLYGTGGGLGRSLRKFSFEKKNFFENLPEPVLPFAPVADHRVFHERGLKRAF